MSNELKYGEYIDSTNPVHIIYPITLGPGESVSIKTSDSNVVCQAFGFEIEIATETMGTQKRLAAVTGTSEYFQTLYSAPVGYEAIIKLIVTFLSSSGNATYTILHTI